MPADWKVDIREATDKIKEIPTIEAAERKRLEQNLARADEIMALVVIPAFREIKTELEKHNIPAEVKHSAPRKGASGLIKAQLGGLIPGKKVEPTFSYSISIAASSNGLEYSSKSSITDRRRQTRSLGEDMDCVKVAVLKSEDIKRRFAAAYKRAAENLRTT